MRRQPAPISLSFLAVLPWLMTACADAPTASPPAVTPLAAVVTTVDRSIVVVSRTAFAPANCTGEGVRLEARLEITSRATTDNRGGFHLNYHVRDLPGATAVGVVTGTPYEWVEVQSETANVDVDELPAVVSTKVVRRFISHGAAPNFLVNLSYHLTIDATGKVTALIDDARRSCT